MVYLVVFVRRSLYAVCCLFFSGVCARWWLIDDCCALMCYCLLCVDSLCCLLFVGCYAVCVVAGCWLFVACWLLVVSCCGLCVI